MPNVVKVGRLGLVFALGCNFALILLSFLCFGSDTVKGLQYSYTQPDDVTFIIWTPIYAAYAHLVLYQVCCPVTKEFRLTGRGLLASNFYLNGAWLMVNGLANRGYSFWLSAAVLLLNLYILVKLYIEIDVDYTRKGVCWISKLNAFVPISMNLSWVLIAAVVNLSNTLFDPNTPSKVAIGGADWAIAVVVIVTFLSSYLAITRMDLAFGLVSFWAILGIHRNQLNGSAPFQGSKELDTIAITCCVVLPIAGFLGVALRICGFAHPEKPKKKEKDENDGRTHHHSHRKNDHSTSSLLQDLLNTNAIEV